MPQVTENTLEDEVEDTGVEVEIDAPEDQESTKPEKVEVESASGEDELESYSQKVQGRIKKLTEKYRKEERDREEAVSMSQKLLEENNKLKNQVKNLDKGYVSSEESRLKSEVASVKQQYREAYESGDSDAMFSAQEQLSQMALMQERVRAARQRLTVQEREPAPQAQQAPQEQQAPQAPQKQAAPDPRAQQWADKNEWFGSDEVMTYASFGIHRKLVEEEGFDPSSDEYYSEVDKRMRSEFPQKFSGTKKSSGAQVASAGASASRSTTKSGRRSVKLSPSQIAMAKRLNVPLEEYAKFVKD